MIRTPIETHFFLRLFFQSSPYSHFLFLHYFFSSSFPSPASSFFPSFLIFTPSLLTTCQTQSFLPMLPLWHPYLLLSPIHISNMEFNRQGIFTNHLINQLRPISMTNPPHHHLQGVLSKYETEERTNRWVNEYQQGHQEWILENMLWFNKGSNIWGMDCEVMVRYL